jgi:RecG-like helicase
VDDRLGLDLRATGQRRDLHRGLLDAGPGFADPALRDAVRTLHEPAPEDLPRLEDGSHPALRRLAEDELTAHAVALRALRETLLARPATALVPSRRRADALLASLPFELTGAQARVVREIATDLLRARPMLRLLQGDVGSGKTLVAILAALH